MLEELQQQYLASLSDKTEELRSLLADFQQGDQLAEPKLRTLAHSLHGSGTTFGFPQISAAARQAELAESHRLQAQVSALIKVLQEATASASPSAARQNILVIDDDPDFAASVVAGFARNSSPYNIVHAATSQIAQELLVKQTFALILLDLVMPDRDGRDLLREIKTEFNLTAPVYVLSAIQKDLIRVECMALGADKFINKPVDVDALVATIDKVIKKNAKRELSLVPMGSEVPTKSGGGAETKPGAASASTISGKAVLVAEDDAMQAAAIKQRLQKEGITVDHASNGAEFLTRMRDKNYALFILDINMPMKNGLEVLQLVRKDPVTNTTPVIMLTAMGSENEIIRAYDLGADDYILKPYSAIQLVARVKTLLKRPR